MAVPADIRDGEFKDGVRPLVDQIQLWQALLLHQGQLDRIVSACAIIDGGDFARRR